MRRVVEPPGLEGILQIIKGDFQLPCPPPQPEQPKVHKRSFDRVTVTWPPLPPSRKLQEVGLVPVVFYLQPIDDRKGSFSA